ncbi:sigma 54-interacting transcriptional regulator [Mesoterricola silvestris]|uniref:Sigma-54 factor interaction domain-containing protein n=1 Tax=Mesoterricola silvestris TaxID=2927979 RepID=A0AA48GVD6_9BACT|nr:sigma 54-interacting transcriptional regulator [Mesoterricola silvestris]BDU71023.1 hypothetical protein METEAL_01970 [Mesoterricola silvestris]
MRNAPPEPELLTDGSEPMGALLRELDLVAPSGLTVLVRGPTGCGKELVVRELHRRSRRPGPLVAVNCAALAEGTLESELFGHVRGAFTGAVRERRGAVASAEGGTLFLDEVGDLTPRVQCMLLRVLQEREVPRVGSDRGARIDVRFAAATNRPLEPMARAGAFREDLLFRLQGTVIRVPPLEQRRHEFPYLVPRLVIRAAQNLGRPAPALERGLTEALASRSWPGNLRQFLHVLEQGLLHSGGEPLGPRHLVPAETGAPPSGGWTEATRAFQRTLLEETLAACGYRAAQAAKVLGMARPSLYATARRLGVNLKRPD